MKRLTAVVLASIVLLTGPAALARPPSGDAPPDGCRDTETRCLIAKYWRGDDRRGLAIARCESGYDPRSQTGDHRGIFQLSRRYHEGRARRMHGGDDRPYGWDDMYDAGKNTVVAWDLYDEQGTGPWESSRSCWG